VVRLSNYFRAAQRPEIVLPAPRVVRLSNYFRAAQRPEIVLPAPRVVRLSNYFRAAHRPEIVPCNASNTFRAARPYEGRE
jgi:hypothetical protein